MYRHLLFKQIFILGMVMIISGLGFANILSISEKIDSLIAKAQTKEGKDLTQAKRYWQEAALLHSGLANLKLAELALQEQPINRKQAIYYYTQAAQYGYPSYYQKVAELVKAERGKEGKESKEGKENNAGLLEDCYQNVAKAVPDHALLNYCQSALVGRFHYSKNQGIQSEFEAEQKAADDMYQFCDDPNTARWIHPEINALERQALFKRICASEIKKQSALEFGDIIVKDGKLFTYTDKGLVDYINPVEDGLVAYRINEPISLFVYQAGELTPLENGDTIIKDNQAFMVKNNRLVQR